MRRQRYAFSPVLHSHRPPRLLRLGCIARAVLPELLCWAVFARAVALPGPLSPLSAFSSFPQSPATPPFLAFLSLQSLWFPSVRFPSSRPCSQSPATPPFLAFSNLQPPLFPGALTVLSQLFDALTWEMALEARLGMVGVSKRSGDAGVSGLCFTRRNEKDVADKCL